VTTLGPDTVLRRAPELDVVVAAAGDVLASAGGSPVSCGPYGLAILDLFGEPRSFADALAALGPRVSGAQDWIDLTSAIARLHGARILRAEGTPESEDDVIVRGSFDSPGPHVAMLNDRVRTSAFLEALRELVRPEDVVVDIGSGTGVLALGAALAGARRVYAIEATPIARHARALFEANAVGERVTLVEGWSTRVELPELADLVVAEILGSEVLEERALHVLLDARRRHLKSDGRLIPSGLKIYGVPVTVPEEQLAEVMFTRSNTGRWASWYGVDLRALGAYSRRLRHRVTVPIADGRSWTTLSEPVLLAELDLESVQTMAVGVERRATATSSGVVNGAFAYFEAALSSEVVVTTDPAADPPVTSWGLPVWLCGEPIDVVAGDSFGFEFEYRGGAGQLRVVP
jgi:SAM-dependent methyltransferase